MQVFFTQRPANWQLNDGSNPYAIPASQTTTGSGSGNGIFRTCMALETLAKAEGNMANIAASEILRVVNLAYLTEMYGDVPYSKADLGRSGNVFPAYDSQKDIYTTMFGLLDDAVSILNDASSTGLDSNQDVMFHGDKSKWIKFANSLKFRLVMHSYNAFKKAGTDNASVLQSIVAGGNYMQANTDNASLPFVGTNSNDSWYLNTATWGNVNNYTEFKPTNSLVQKLIGLNDPRLYVWFAPALKPASAAATAYPENVQINGFSYTIMHDPVSNPKYTNTPVASFDDNGNPINVSYPLDARWFGAPKSNTINVIYDGAAAGSGNNDNYRLTGLSSLFKKAGGDSRLSAVLMEASEMQFLLAEARAKNLISSGTASGYYNAGISLSFSRWQIADGVTPASYDGSTSIQSSYSAYLTSPGVALTGDANDLTKIYFQKWVANFLTNHTEELTEIRRNGAPTFIGNMVTKISIYSYPFRYQYPFDEQNNNLANYNAAISGLTGGDIASAPMWIFK